MINSPHEVFDLAGRIFGLGILTAGRSDITSGELPVEKVDDLAGRIYCLGFLDALSQADGRTHADRILAGEAEGIQYAAYSRADQGTTLIFALCPTGEAARRFLGLGASD